MHRTWLKFQDGAFSSANLFALRNMKCCSVLPLWASAERDRKSANHFLRHFGPLLCLRALARSIVLGGMARHAGRRIGINARLVVLDDVKAVIDVDKISDYRLAESISVARELADRNRSAYAAPR